MAQPTSKTPQVKSSWPKPVIEAYQKAKIARENAHAPYSRFKVGAAIKFQGSRRVFAGCNVENSSFGGTNCAEQTALFSGIAELGASPIEYIVIVTSQTPPAPPCGICRQALAEFASDDTPVFLADLKGIKERILLGELLPKAFRNFKV